MFNWRLKQSLKQLKSEIKSVDDLRASNHRQMQENYSNLFNRLASLEAHLGVFWGIKTPEAKAQFGHIKYQKPRRKRK